MDVATDPTRHSNYAAAGEIWVILPDMFQSFLKHTPPHNPQYEAVRLESEQWLNNFCGFSGEMKRRIHKCDFSYFCAIVAPCAPADRLRILCDWGNWVFPYDDMFDVEGLADDPRQAQRVMDSLLSSFIGEKETSHEKIRIVQAHEDLALRLFSGCSSEIKWRYIQSMQEYKRGVLAHVDTFHRLAPHSLSLERKIETRRESAGVSPLYHLAEYAHDLKIPDSVFKNSVVRELEILGMDMVFITNDILSYQKEEPAGVPDSIIAACRLEGMSAQEAFDTAGRLLEYRYQRWEIAEKSIPSWGDTIDIEIRKYVDCIKAVVKANLYWSFKSDRYLGRDAKQVRKDRRIKVMKSPQYLQGPRGA